MASGGAERGYRKDIDGLRALAVVPIVLLHSALWRLPAGFTGVDIFFVISGFLITAILLREAGEGRFSIAGFYRRRVVRILPALLAMLVLVTLAGALLLFAPDARRVGLGAAAAAGMVANIGVWLRTGYFAHNARWEPLLHSWSLGVEEQFYLLYPLLLWAVLRFAPGRVRAVLAGVTLASFVGGFVLGRFDADAPYYLLPGRAWELTLGGLVAAGAFPALQARGARDAAALGGLGLIVAGFFLVPNTGFPVPWALMPCAGTVLLLAYGGDAVTARGLGAPPLRWVGLISYSLYLWHWPIIVFHRLLFGDAPSLMVSAMLVGLSFAAAALSYGLIEQPARRAWRNARPGRAIAGGLLAIAATVALGLGVAWHAASTPADGPAGKVAAYIDYVRSPGHRAQFRSGTCFIEGSNAEFRDDLCLAWRDDRPNVLLLGDSHAAHLWRAMAERFPGVNLMQATASTCLPLIDTRGARYCTDLVYRMLGPYLSKVRVSRVVLAGNWRPGDVDAVAGTIRALRGRGIAVTVIGPVNQYDGEVPRLLANAIRAGDPSRIARYRLGGPAKVERLLRPRVEAAGGHYLSLLDLECPAGRCVVLTPQGAPLHFDGGHLTPEGARLLMRGVPAL